MTLTMVQFEPLGAVAMIFRSVMVSGGMPRRAAAWAACNGPGSASAPAIPAAAATGTDFRMSRRFIGAILLRLAALGLDGCGESVASEKFANGNVSADAFFRCEAAVFAARDGDELVWRVYRVQGITKAEGLAERNGGIGIS